MEENTGSTPVALFFLFAKITSPLMKGIIILAKGDLIMKQKLKRFFDLMAVGFAASSIRAEY